MKKLMEWQKEILGVLASEVILFILLLIAFPKEPLQNTIILSLTYWYCALIPGYAFLFGLRKDYSIFERLLMGSAVGGILVGTISFYAGRLGWLVYTQWFLPFLIVAIILGIHLWHHKR